MWKSRQEWSSSVRRSVELQIKLHWPSRFTALLVHFFFFLNGMPDGPLFIAIQTGECTTLLIHMGLACEHCSGRSSVVESRLPGLRSWFGLG